MRLTDIAKAASGKLGLGIGGGGAHDESGSGVACVRAQGATRAGHRATVHAL